MRQYVIVFSIVVVILASMTLNTKSQPQSPVLHGWEPYTPTKLEWFSVELNASYRIELNQDNGYLLLFYPIQKEDTIVIMVRYRPSVQRETINVVIESARQAIKASAEFYGWDKWLKVREDVQMTK